MSQPSLTVLGVYKPKISAETWQVRLDSTGEGTQEHFDGLVLIEMLANGIEERLDLGDIGQKHAEPDGRDLTQVAYDEGLLSAHGETLLARGFDWKSGDQRGSFRFAFYLHMYDPALPLLTPFGEVACPAVQDVPVRLMMLMPYTACD